MTMTSPMMAVAAPTGQVEQTAAPPTSAPAARSLETGPPAGIPSSATSPARQVQEEQQHSLPLSVTLHVLPGVIMVMVYLLMGPFVRALGHPQELSKYLFALPLGVIVVELAIMLAVGKRRSGRVSLDQVVLYRQSMPIWQYGVLGVALLAWNVIIYIPVQQVTADWLNNTLFTWVPAWYSAEGDYTTYSRPALVALCVLFTVVNGLSAGIEELYFRGYLLPRISRFLWWSPLINTILFSLYHLDMFGSVVAVFLGSLPLAYVAYWKKNVSLAIVMHGGLNALYMLVLFLPLLLR
jgi:CAAX protease family protein